MRIGKNINPMNMKNQSSLTTAPVAEMGTSAFGKTFVIKKGILEPDTGLLDETDPGQKPFKTDGELNKLVFANRAVVFGEHTIGMLAKEGSLAGKVDALLFDFTLPAKPRCFFLKTILRQEPFADFFLSTTWVLEFIRNPESLRTLVESLAAEIEHESALADAFSAYLGKDVPVTEFLQSVIPWKCQCLLLTDESRPELPSLITAYPETWGAKFSAMYFLRLQVGKTAVLSVHPSFNEIGPKPEPPKPIKEKIIHTDDHHFTKGSDVVRTIYERLKKEAMKVDKRLVFNPSGGHYIAMKIPGGKNLAFFHFRKTSIYLVVKLEEKFVRKMVRKSEVKTLPESVQKFWNGTSTGLVITGTENLKEISEVLKKLIKQ